ncbi:MauE/DoxX family redox-associated membrane protein [Flagellimonas sp. HSM57]|uniref:DoxX family protein n=1 Tax=Flagellimonas sp. HSM57 TaxID=2654675 RepID=UPI003977D95F
MKRIFFYAFVVFYFLAGIYHFVNPEFYYSLIPDYLPFPKLLNAVSGLSEITFGVLVLFSKTRKIGGYVIILLLLLFIPSHIYFIQTGSCADNSLCVSPWISWSRLLIIHPLLLFWAWWISQLKLHNEI